MIKHIHGNTILNNKYLVFKFSRNHETEPGHVVNIFFVYFTHRYYLLVIVFI